MFLFGHNHKYGRGFHCIFFEIKKDAVAIAYAIPK